MAFVGGSRIASLPLPPSQALVAAQVTRIIRVIAWTDNNNRIPHALYLAVASRASG
jgi:hypothetical protein